MTCNHNNNPNNYCGECGTSLKELCYKCGKLEKIGINYCETEASFLSEARKERYYFLDSKLDFWMSINIVINSILITVILITGSFLYIIGHEQIGTIICKSAGWWFLISIVAIPFLTSRKNQNGRLYFTRNTPNIPMFFG